jgi:hypothetical protein
MAKELPTEVELAPSGLLVPKGSTPPPRRDCGYIGSNYVKCTRPAHYEFELDPRHWPGVKPPIKQYACQEHGKDARTMVGVIYIKTI